jgi:hypothetical protein
VFGELNEDLIGYFKVKIRELALPGEENIRCAAEFIAQIAGDAVMCDPMPEKRVIVSR